MQIGDDNLLKHNVADSIIISDDYRRLQYLKKR